MVCLADLKNEGMHFSTKFIFFWNLNLFDLEDIDLGSPKLHAIETFNHTTFHKNLVILAFIGAELVGRGQILPAPPPPVRVILNPIPGRGLS